MNKKVSLLLTIPLLFTLGSCGGETAEPIDDVLESRFKIDATDYEIDFGTEIALEPFSAKDKDGVWRDAIISVKDPNGNEVTMEEYRFVPEVLGGYKITYALPYGTKENQFIKKEYTITVSDLSAPEVTGFSKDNLVLLGSEIDLSKIKAHDLYDGDIVPEIEVYYNGVELRTDGNKFVANKGGTYIVKVKATDSHNNVLEQECNVFTVIDYEDGIAQESSYYPIEISSDFAYNGEKSGRIHWFDQNVNWLNDKYCLGSDCSIDPNAKYISFWVFFDGLAQDMDKLLIQTKYTYYDTKVFDEYGEPLNYWWNFVLTDDASQALRDLYPDGKFSYEMNTNKWYRIVIDLKTLTEASCYGRTLEGVPIDGPLYHTAKPNPTSLGELVFGFGSWDDDIPGVPTKVCPTYVDNIRLTNSLDDEVYHTK